MEVLGSLCCRNCNGWCASVLHVFHLASRRSGEKHSTFFSTASREGGLEPTRRDFVSYKTKTQRLAQRAVDTRFRQALIEHGPFRYGITVLENGIVELLEHYISKDGVKRVLRVAIVSDKVTVHAYNGLRVEPVEDESGHQYAQTMGITGEVDFDLSVHSVRFTIA